MITFDEKNGLFHLKNQYLSCVLCLREDDEGMRELLSPYLGAPLDDPQSALALANDHEHASFDLYRQSLPYACPTDGRGDFRPAMLCVKEPSGQRIAELGYVGHEIAKGKRALAGLPATYVQSEDEAETLTVTLRDAVSGLKAELSYTLFRDLAAVATSLRLVNEGNDALTLENAASLCLTLQGRYDLIHLHGGWAKERQVERVKPARLTRSIESCRGASGHEHNPFAALAREDATEFHGECYGVSLVYSGDFRILADENAFDTTRLIAGLNPRTLEWRLAPGEIFQTPEAVVAYSQGGLNGMSQTFHRLYRTRLCRGYWRDRERPILINNWEATYFRFDHEKILSIARAAADLGVELFVLDDGWFGKRDDDNCSLGDWVADRRKLPGGVEALASDIHAMGLSFGLWFEPEMVSPDSDLYRAHPDWCLHAEGRRRTQARRQLVLDLSRTDVQDYIIESVSKTLQSAQIDYVKWDMNRNFAEAGSALLKDGRQGELHHRYMLGVYRVMEEITQAFPKVLFEGCSGGGGRFDAGMLYYMPQYWTSDDTDAVERLFIQYGTSLCYPPSAMSAHVSAVPNHQVGRVTSMKMRGDVALSGNFGYELDLSRQTQEDTEEIRRQIALVKTIRKTVQQGAFTRLESPYEDNIAAWQFTNEHSAILCAYQILRRANRETPMVRMRGLESGARYRLESGEIVSADALMNVGVRLALPGTDYASFVLVMEKIQ